MITDTKPLSERLPLARSIEQHRNSVPGAIASGSPAQIIYALKDDKHDILMLAEALDAQDALLREAAEVLRPFAEAYKAHDDPGISDLDNEQPVAWHVPLGVFRRARSLLSKLTEATKP